MNSGWEARPFKVKTSVTWAMPSLANQPLDTAVWGPPWSPARGWEEAWEAPGGTLPPAAGKEASSAWEFLPEATQPK